MQRLLVLGGTRFLGRAVVDAALARDLHVTLFNRGVSGPPPTGVETILGDRTTSAGLAALRGQEFDAVIDTSGFVPSHVLASAEALVDQVSHYVFVSTVSAYRDWPRAAINDTSPTLDCSPHESRGDLDYGTLKAGCERAVTAVFGDRSLIVRPGFLIGPHDDNGRLPWWLEKLRDSAVAVAPAPPDRGIRLLDVRDAADWLVGAAISRLSGSSVLTGPAGRDTMASLLAACATATGSSCQVIWRSEAELLAAGVEPMAGLPYWHPDEGLWLTDASSAERSGLQCRPLAASVADTAEWLRAAGGYVVKDGLPTPGLDPTTELALLEGASSA